MILGIDHIVILVGDLEAASADYTALGFTVVPGGEHTDGATHNALIAFADGSYLELLAFKRAAADHHWWLHTTAGNGLIDFALQPDSLADDIAAMAERGLCYKGPIGGGRLRPDGQRIEWELGMPPTPDLPFLCADVTPRALRVPDGVAWQHANGVMGIAGVTIAVADISASAARYRALLRAEDYGEVRLPGFAVAESGAHSAVFPLAGATMTLAAPAPDSHGPLHDRLDAHGEGIFALRLRSSIPAGTGPLNAERAHGARIELVH